MKVSKYFTLDEMVGSAIAERQGLDNTPTIEVAVTATLTALMMDKVREILGVPIIPSSWIRTPAVNTAVGTKNPKSQHIRGEAVDFRASTFGTPIEIAKVLAANKEKLQLDQLILEYSWVHISFPINPPRKPRLEVLTLLADGSYASGITDKSGKPIT